MDERILTMADKIKEQWPTLFGASAQALAEHLHNSGYRLDPYPYGKSKDELIARIEAVEAERDKTRNLLRAEHEWAIKAVIGTESDTMGEAMTIHRRRKPDCSICTFLAETSSVKL